MLSFYLNHFIYCLDLQFASKSNAQVFLKKAPNDKMQGINEAHLR